MTRVYTLEILVIDHEMVGEDEIIRKLEDSYNFQGLKINLAPQLDAKPSKPT